MEMFRILDTIWDAPNIVENNAGLAFRGYFDVSFVFCYYKRMELIQRRIPPYTEYEGFSI